MKHQGASMAGENDPSTWQAITAHMPWIASIALFVAGLWSTLIGWLWKRQTHRVDNHGDRLRELEKHKADRAELQRLQEWLRQDVGALHEAQRDTNRKLDQMLGYRE